MRIQNSEFRSRIKFAFCILQFAFFTFFHCSFAESGISVLGLWVPCEGENKTLSSRSKLIQMLDFAKELGAKEIFLQVYRRNHSWYKSELAESLPFREIQAKEKMDPLAFAIREAHARGLRIHAWLNVYWIGKDLNIPIIRKLGKDLVTRDQKGRSLVDYPENKIPPPEGGWYSYGEDGYWLDPGDERVQGYLMGIFREILTGYPDLDGLHLDFVRYPFTSPFLPGSYYTFNRGIEFGYGAQSIERFKKRYGLNPLAMKRTPQNHFLWDTWRRDQITELIRNLRQFIRQNHSGKSLSCAVLPWPERSYFSAFQDWSKWTRQGIVDFAVTMNYTLDLRLAENLSRMNMAMAGTGQVWVGLGPYLFESDVEGFLEELKIISALAPSGLVLFSYDALLKDPRLVSALKQEFHGKS